MYFIAYLECSTNEATTRARIFSTSATRIHKNLLFFPYGSLQFAKLSFFILSGGFFTSSSGTKRRIIKNSIQSLNTNLRSLPKLFAKPGGIQVYHNLTNLLA